MERVINYYYLSMKFTVKDDEVMVITFASIIALVFSATLVKLVWCKDHKKLIIIIVLFILANLTLIISYHTFIKSKSAVLINTWKRLFIASAQFIYFACFDVAVWLFGFEYYNMVRLIPYQLEEMPPPPGLIKCNKI